MKNFFPLLLFSLFSLVCLGQGGTWTWVSGDSVTNAAGAYGIQGVPSVNNHPPGVYEACDWKDKQGNFWLYGGVDSSFIYGDLWKYSPNTNEWTWVKGNGTNMPHAVHIAKGVPDIANTPGARGYCSATWVDTAGNLWLFGGANTDALNDLWQYNIGTNEWTWVNAASTVSGKGVHGIEGIPSPSNIPGARTESCSAWTDSLNNLWLFGGHGYDNDDNVGELDDLFKYDISTNEWTWMNGSKLADNPPNYGLKGIARANNGPGARWTYTKWKDLNNNFWIMGGLLYDSTSGSSNPVNDVWKYDVSINEWIWMGGPNTTSDTGNYGSACIYSDLNMPYSRFEQRSSVTDNCGRFWLFGGSSNLDSGNCLNDLWLFDSQRLQWKLAKGTNTLNQVGYYGSMGTPALNNVPPSRLGALAWWGNDNKFYLYGGFSDVYNTYSDMWVFNQDTSCTPCTAYIYPPVANFQSNNSSICTFDCISFTNLSVGATSYQWLFSGALDSLSTDTNPQNICYANAGVYNVMLIASGTAGADTIVFNNYINVNSSPSVPVITQHHDTLFCSTDPAYTSYQWYRDSNLIPNATDTFVVIPYGGNYNVKVTNEFGCAISAGANILGVKNYIADHIISLSPNPATDKIYIKSNQPSNKGTVTIFNVLGQEISPPVNLTPNLSPLGEGGAVIDIGNLAGGVYFVRVTNETGNWTGKFVKE